MSKTIEQILHFKNILAVIEQLKGDVPGGIVPDAMFSPTKQIIGRSGSYLKVENTRRVAQQVFYGSPSKTVTLKGVSEVPIRMIHSFLHFDHEATLLEQLKSTDEQRQLLATAEIGRKTREFVTLFTNLQRAAVYSALTTGKIMFDDEGELTMESTQATVTIDFGIPAGNKNQLDALGDGDILDVKWSDAASDIGAQIIKLQKAAIQLTGYKLRYAYYGANVAAYIAKNTTAKEYLKFNSEGNRAVLAGGIPADFLEIIWKPAFSASYQDKDGDTHFFWPDNCVVFTPDPLDFGWWGYLEGSFPVPVSLQISPDGRVAFDQLASMFGMFGFAHPVVDPPTIRQYGGTTFLPVIAVPKSCFIGTVEF